MKKAPTLFVSNILKPGTPFIVTDEVRESTFGPGTLGFVSSVIASGMSYLTASISAVIIRRGKSGKPRLDVNQIFIPIYLFESESLQDNIPKGSRYYVHINKNQQTSSIANMEPIDFLGWCTAYGCYLSYIAKFSKHGVKWPEDKSDPLHKAISMRNIWGNNAERALERYTTPEMKEKIVSSLRVKEAELTKCGLIYKANIAKVEEQALTYLAKKKIVSINEVKGAISTAQAKVTRLSKTANIKPSKKGKLTAHKISNKYNDEF